MTDREPRKRKKRRDGPKKEDLNTEEVTFSSKKFHEEVQKDSEPEPEEEIVPHEPSVVARVIFFLIFSLLMLATGAVFIALHDADRSVDVINGMEVSHSEELISHELPVPYTEEWKAEEPSKEVIEEPELWTEDTVKSEQNTYPDSLQEEEPSTLSEETLDHIEYYTQMPFEEIVEQPEPEETDMFSRQDEINEKEFVENYIDDNQQSYYEDDIEVFPVTENSIDYEEVISDDHTNDISDIEEMQEPSVQETSELPISIVESSYSSEKIEIKPLQVQIEESDSIEEQLKILPETTEYSQEEFTENQNIQSDIEPSNDEQEETSFSKEKEYEKADITNKDDFQIKDELDEIDSIIDKSPGRALKMFQDVLKNHPKSPRAHFGKARTLDNMAEEQRSNSVLEQAIAAYTEVLHLPDVPDKIFFTAGKKGIERMIFRGFVGKAIQLQLLMVEHFPEDADLKNKLAISYLLIGKGQQAKKILKEVLQKEPSNGFAKVHYGFILKTEDNNYPEAIKYMSEGISTREPGVIDGRFYFHLGDALSRTGKVEEAMKVYENGVNEGVFFSVYQRSLYNVEGLTGKPWWQPQDTPYYSAILMLEEKWQIIRNEALSLMDDTQSGFLPENEGLRDTGDWKQFDLFARGQKNKNCKRAPVTCSLIEKIPDAAGCTRGQVKFSILQPGTHIWAHTGPTNCRLRAHLGLMIPKKVKIRVANDTREWKQGKVIMFDDSFEHEVWHNGDTARLVLIVDFWHPELTARHKATLTPI